MTYTLPYRIIFPDAELYSEIFLCYAPAGRNVEARHRHNTRHDLCYVLLRLFQKPEYRRIGLVFERRFHEFLIRPGILRVKAYRHAINELEFRQDVSSVHEVRQPVRIESYPAASFFENKPHLFHEVKPY